MILLDPVFSELNCSLGMECETDMIQLDGLTKELSTNMSMDLEDFKFDFDSISDLNLGPWIQTNDLKFDVDMSDIEDNSKSDTTDFEELNITEAVRYDCMWSSNPSSKMEATSRNSQLLCENSLFEEFLRSIDNSTQFELAIDPKEIDVKQEVKSEPSSIDSSSTEEEQKSIEEHQNDVRMFTSLDHCYVSSYTPTSDRHAYSNNFPVTPPESSEDEDSTALSSVFPHVINPSSVTRPSQSLLKTSRPKSSCSSGEAKFCFRVKLKSDKSRSLLKEKFRLVTSSTPVKKPGIMNRSLVQSNLRRRKEESLKLKHQEAREIHNHMERQRRNELKVAFDDLKAAIPDIAKSDKVSKQMILDTALDNCKLLKSREQSLRLRREKLKRRNLELAEKLKSLQDSSSSRRH